MKMKRFILTFAAIAAICAASAAGSGRSETLPCALDGQPEMAAAVDKKAGELWYSEPKSVEEWNKITGGYTEWPRRTPSKPRSKLGVTIRRKKSRASQCAL